ncbi:MAG TPA: hypothetical protein VFG76_12885 [Candidatus Polarisedimenticolia bacterium]|nr:hypothetical protein [Candidatus Polarisedimenticolia bacterium]
MTLDELLKIPSRPTTQDDVASGMAPPTIGERLAELIYKNGKRIEITSWGVIEFGGLYGEYGLHQNEAFELLYLSGLARGFVLGSGGAIVEKQVMAWIEAEWARVESTLKQGAADG